MPAKSAAQKRLMDAAAHNPAFAKKVGIPSKVAKEYSEKSKGMTFRKGDQVKNTSRMNKLEEMGRLDSEKAYTSKGKKNLAAEKKRVVGDIMGMKKGGEAKESKAMAKKEIAFMQKKGAPKSMIKHEKAEYGMKKGGMAASKMGAVKTAKPKMGSASSRADGIAQRGKTVGKMLRKGGMCK